MVRQHRATKRTLVADFETSYTDETKTARRVVLAGYKEVNGDKIKKFYVNTTKNIEAIELFFNSINNYTKNIKEKKLYVYFHNLDYDGSYIEDYFLRKNFYFEEVREGNSKTLYSIKFKYNNVEVIIYDSLKLYTMPLAKIGEIFDYPKLVDTYDYKKIRYNSLDFSKVEVDYFERDINILDKLMINHLKTHRSVKSTRASYAYNKLRQMVYKRDKDTYNKIFKPMQTFELNSYVRGAYYGGVSYLNETYEGKLLGRGMTFDVNSLYPYVMTTNYPIDQGEQMERPKFDVLVKNALNGYWIATIDITALTLKDGGVPTLPKKLFSGSSNVVRSLDELGDNHVITLTNIDYHHLQRNYNFTCKFITGLVYSEIAVTPFKDFILENNKLKEQAVERGDMFGKTVNKLTNNSSYGKFAQSPVFTNANPYLDTTNDTVSFWEGQDEVAETFNNIVIAVFVTAKARNVLFNAIYSVNESKGFDFVYADTDSIHIIQTDPNADYMDIDIPHSKSELGKWKQEENFLEAMFLRSKVYIERSIKGGSGFGKDRDLTIKAAGFNNTAKTELARRIDAHGWSAFKFGIKLPVTMKKRMQGGYDLIDGFKEIKENPNTIKKVVDVVKNS